MEDKILNFLGLAARAGKVVSGEFSVEKLIKANKAKLVLVALDASDPTKKLKIPQKQQIYKSDIVYTTHSALGFDYLEENLATSQSKKFLPKFYFCLQIL